MIYLTKIELISIVALTMALCVLFWCEGYWQGYWERDKEGHE
jgi:hypothetical protein